MDSCILSLLSCTNISGVVFAPALLFDKLPAESSFVLRLDFPDNRLTFSSTLRKADSRRSCCSSGADIIAISPVDLFWTMNPPILHPLACPYRNSWSTYPKLSSSKNLSQLKVNLLLKDQSDADLMSHTRGSEA